MKKLLYGLLVLTGAGMLGSCQQDEVVSEAPVNKGVTIRASLPNDEQSRVVLGNTEGDTGTTTQVYWEEGDKITLQIGETSYEFTISDDYDDENPSTSAEFTYDGELAEVVSGETYTFTYGAAPQKEQAGTKDGLSAHHLMQATYTAKEGDGWGDVLLSFSTQVALVEISLDEIDATKVSMYDVKTGACLATATAAEGTPFTEKVYFSVLPGTYEALFMMEYNSATYVKKVSENTLEANKLYRIEAYSGELLEAYGEVVRYFTLDGTTYIYGQGEIPERAFANNKDLTSVVILEGVTGIGANAFCDCSSLRSISLPASVTTIGERAFQYCFNLCNITLPANVQSIGSNTFYGCNNLETVNCLAETPPSLGYYVFEDTCEWLLIYVPDDLVDAYKGASRWSDYEPIIYPISDREE